MRIRALLPSLQFDLIYINAGPSWQTFLDIFIQSIALAHKKSIFIVNAVVPAHPYGVLPGASNQTIIWRSGGTRNPFFPSPAAISRLDYFEMLEHAALLMPVEAEMLPRLLGMHLRPADYAGSADWKKLVTPLVPSQNRTE